MRRSNAGAVFLGQIPGYVLDILDIKDKHPIDPSRLLLVVQIQRNGSYQPLQNCGTGTMAIGIVF